MDSSKTVRLAVVQQDRVTRDVEKSREKALRFTAQALEHKPDVILLQEALLVDNGHPGWQRFAETVDGPTTQAFRDLLKGTGTKVIYGLVETDGQCYYQSAPCVTADGVVTNYRKTHLFGWYGGQEAALFTPGDRLVTFDVKGHKAGIMICYDGDFPEMARSYANLGCTMLFWMNKRDSRGHEERNDGSVVRDLARTNSLIMAVSCGCRPEKQGGFSGGGSNITNHDGELLAEIWGAEGFVCADVEPDTVLPARQNNCWFGPQRRDLYG